MNASLALAVIAGLVVAATAVGVATRVRSGRIRRARLAGSVDLRALGIAETDDVADLVQFSTEYCARCPGVKRALVALTHEEPGVSVHEVDLTHRAELAARFRVLQTPTVLLIAPDGTEAARFTGAVRPESVRHHLARLQEVARVRRLAAKNGTLNGLVA